MDIEQLLRGVRVAIVTHDFTWGAVDELFEYLQKNSKLVVFVKHPFYFSHKRNSYVVTVSEGHKLITKLKPRTFVTILDYILDFFATLFYFLTVKHGFHLFIGADPLNALSGLVLKRLRRTQAVIFYSIDYTAERFNNTMLNLLYHWVDSFVTKNSDFTWNISPRMIEARKKKIGADLENQFVTPVPIDVSLCETISKRTKKKNYSLIFAGTLHEETGLELVLEAIYKLQNLYQGITLTIIGEGPRLDFYSKLVRDMDLQDRVEIRGFIESRVEFLRVLSSHKIGVAITKPIKGGIAEYADVGKVKSYAACGLPMIISYGSFTAEEVSRCGCGIAVNYRTDEVVNAIVTLFSSDAYERYSVAATQYAEKFSHSRIFGPPLLVALDQLCGRKMS